MSFEWDVTPEQAFGRGIEQWETRLRDGLFDLMEQGSVEAEEFMKAYAPWQNRTWKARSGLSAYPWDASEIDGTMGMTATYSGAINPDTNEDYSYALEQRTFPIAGILSIILARREPTFLGEFARSFFDRVRARIGDGTGG